LKGKKRIERRGGVGKKKRDLTRETWGIKGSSIQEREKRERFPDRKASFGGEGELLASERGRPEEMGKEKRSGRKGRRGNLLHEIEIECSRRKEKKEDLSPRAVRRGGTEKSNSTMEKSLKN